MRGPPLHTHPLPPRVLRLLPPLVLLALVHFAAFGRAWVCDDAYLTFRTIDNFARGLGLRWNALERVQVYTHPLWMLLMAGLHAFTREFFYSSIALSLALSAGALLVFAFRLARSPALSVLGLTILLFSKAFLDYSTSGLENPLVHLLLALFLWSFLAEGDPTAGRVLALVLLASLLATTRMDLALLLLPALVSVVLARLERGRSLKETLRAAAPGAAPLVAWEIFSLFYYGFLFPNSAYAKLDTGLPHWEMVRRGAEYFVNSIRLDPPTLLAIAAGLAAAFLGRRGRDRLVAGGVALYLVYILLIGGDFMSGRFLTAPLLAAVTLLARSALDGRIAWAIACGVAVAFGLVPLSSPFQPAVRYPPGLSHPALDAYGIADERAVYDDGASLRKAPADGPWPNPSSFRQAQEIRADWTDHTWIPWLKGFGIVDADETWPLPAPEPGARDTLTPVVARAGVGFLGFYLGPEIHVLDYLALGDPLLARLPALKADPTLPALYSRFAWKYRVGHFVRKVPLGYFETLITGQNRIRDPGLASYYDHLALITRGPLWDRLRLLEVLKMNLGFYDGLLEAAAR